MVKHTFFQHAALEPLSLLKLSSYAGEQNPFFLLLLIFFGTALPHFVCLIVFRQSCDSSLSRFFATLGFEPMTTFII